MISKCHTGFCRFPREFSVGRMTKQMKNGASPDWFPHRRARLALRAYGPWAVAQGYTQKSLVLECSAVATFIFLIILCFNLCSLSEVWWVNGACTWAEDMYTIYGLFALCSCWPTWAQFWWMPDAWEFSKTQIILCLQGTKQARALVILQRTYFSFKPELDLNAGRRKWHWRKHEWSRNLVISHPSQQPHMLRMT
jgi:hypothetical protein